MRRTPSILVLTATALALPAAAADAAAAPEAVLADAAPLTRAAPPPREAPSLSRVPLAVRGDAAALLADRPEQAGELLAQAPRVSATPPAQLPRTGADAWLTALLGAGLLLTGAGLRLRLRDGAPSDAAPAGAAGAP